MPTPPFPPRTPETEALELPVFVVVVVVVVWLELVVPPPGLNIGMGKKVPSDLLKECSISLCSIGRAVTRTPAMPRTESSAKRMMTVKSLIPIIMRADDC